MYSAVCIKITLSIAVAQTEKLSVQVCEPCAQLHSAVGIDRYCLVRADTNTDYLEVKEADN